MEIISLGQRIIALEQPFDMDDIPRFVENQYKLIDKQELKSNPSHHIMN